jgi:hypothetical protein
MASAQSKIFIVKPKVQRAGAEQPPRLIRAERLSQVEKCLLDELSIEVATQDQCIEAAKIGIDVEGTAKVGAEG